MSVAKRTGMMLALGLSVTMHSGCISLSALMGQSQAGTLDTRMLEAQGYSIPPGGMPSPVAPPTNGASRIILEVRDGERHLESIPLAADQPVFVQDIVQQASLHERFGELAISIMRPDSHGGPPIRLEVRTDDDGRATSVGHNYALQAGDHLVVNPDNRSPLQRMLDKQFRRR